MYVAGEITYRVPAVHLLFQPLPERLRLLLTHELILSCLVQAHCSDGAWRAGWRQNRAGKDASSDRTASRLHR
ncbi:hypothetical protein GCM10023198_30900 [Promicromonospora umidemergens]|uniref:Uncharacterized protein n=1 Tax=Promicromonospora umidemergens TaxID=629679 RepID=A0ABP8XGR3_9MICO